jgi:hypothetical protein
MVVESAADSEEKLVCNPGWVIKDQENLVNDGAGGLNSVFSFEEVTSFGEGYVVRLSFGGFFQDTFGPEGWGFENPAQEFRPDSISFEGIQMRGETAGTFNYEIQEYWSYGGTYDTTTGQPL